MAAPMSLSHRSPFVQVLHLGRALCLALAVTGTAAAEEGDAGAGDPTYSWVEMAVQTTEADPEADLAERRVLEERLQRAESRGQRRRTAILLGRTAPLLVRASNQVWGELLQGIDASEDLATAIDDLDTTDADALADEALRRLERAIGAVESGDVGGLKKRANGWRLDAARLRRARQDYDQARALLERVVDGPAKRPVRRAAAIELGEMRFDDGDTQAALAAYRVAARLGGAGDSGPYAHYRIGWCQLRMGEFLGATGSLLQAFRDAEDRSLARQARTDALRVAAALEVEDALAVVEAACVDDPEECVARERASLADRMDASGRPDAADAVRSLR
jgi:tetratricopeptide (TPR) repeat protein